MTLFEVYKSASALLSEKGIPDFEYDAKRLLLHAFGISPEQYAIYKNEPCDDARLKLFQELLKRRLEREPLQYLLGKWEFFGREFHVDGGCLIPRSETEIAVEAAVELNIPNCRFADLCSGSGCIGISYALEAQGSRGFLLDVSKEALRVSGTNAQSHGLSDERLQIKQFDLFTDTLPEGLDLLISNPPYIDAQAMKSLEKELDFEPSIALFGGEDGLDFYRVICEKHVSKMKKGAFIVLELGIGQSEAVTRMLSDAGAVTLKLIKDGAGIERTLVAEKK